MIREFVNFLKQYGVVGLAIAVVIGGKLNELVSATVRDLLMPIVGMLVPNGDWQKWVLTIGPLRIAIGDWLGVALDFVIVAFFVFIVAKTFLGDVAQIAADSRNKASFPAYSSGDQVLEGHQPSA